MKLFLLFLLGVFTTGCMTYAECSWHHEAEIVQITWENEFGPELTSSEEECLHAFFLYYIDDMKRWCGNDRVVGCTTQRQGNNDAAARIYIKQGLKPQTEEFTIRHELTHRITHCVLRSEYETHQHEAFAFSGEVSAPGSLAVISQKYEDSASLVCE